MTTKKADAGTTVGKALAETILRLENDSQLGQHPEWAGLIAQARKASEESGPAECTILERGDILHLQSLVAQGVAGETQRAAKARRYDDRNLGSLVAKDAERKKAVMVGLDNKLDKIMEAVLA